VSEARRKQFPTFRDSLTVGLLDTVRRNQITSLPKSQNGLTDRVEMFTLGLRAKNTRIARVMSQRYSYRYYYYYCPLSSWRDDRAMLSRDE